MKKFYEKNELWFAIAWIVVYCGVSVPIRGAYGDESAAMLAGLAVIAAGLLAFVKTAHLEEKYGLVKWRGHAREYLFFLPALVLMTGNLWGGVGMAYSGPAVPRAPPKRRSACSDHDLRRDLRHRAYRQPPGGAGRPGVAYSSYLRRGMGLSAHDAVLSFRKPAGVHLRPRDGGRLCQVRHRRESV